MSGRRVLVTGGRDYADREAVFAALDGVRASEGIACVIEGGARRWNRQRRDWVGADYFAMTWAQERGLAPMTFRADWEQFGKAAGPRRNQRMLNEARPDLVLAFPGGTGTADMVARAERAGIEVRHFSQSVFDFNGVSA